jgi:hypothetical protein
LASASSTAGCASSGEAKVHVGIYNLRHEFADDVVMAVRRHLDLRNGTIIRHELRDA